MSFFSGLTYRKNTVYNGIITYDGGIVETVELYTRSLLIKMINLLNIEILKCLKFNND